MRLRRMLLVRELLLLLVKIGRLVVELFLVRGFLLAVLRGSSAWLVDVGGRWLIKWDQWLLLLYLLLLFLLDLI